MQLCSLLHPADCLAKHVVATQPAGTSTVAQFKESPAAAASLDLHSSPWGLQLVCLRQSFCLPLQLVSLGCSHPEHSCRTPRPSGACLIATGSNVVYLGTEAKMDADSKRRQATGTARLTRVRTSELPASAPQEAKARVLLLMQVSTPCFGLLWGGHRQL